MDELQSQGGSAPLPPPVHLLLITAMESRAPSYTTNETRFASIEFPGPVKSIPRALRALGGLSHISTVLSSPDALDKPELELNLSTGNPFFHPVQAAIRDTGNVVMKVVKRRRKVPRVGEDGKEELGLFSMEVVGTADRTVRFRGAYADPKPRRELMVVHCCYARPALRLRRLPAPYQTG